MFKPANNDRLSNTRHAGASHTQADVVSAVTLLPVVADCRTLSWISVLVAGKITGETGPLGYDGGSKTGGDSGAIGGSAGSAGGGGSAGGDCGGANGSSIVLTGPVFGAPRRTGSASAAGAWAIAARLVNASNRHVPIHALAMAYPACADYIEPFPWTARLGNGAVGRCIVHLAE